MGAITVRNIPAKTQQALRELAAANGRSMEAEVRALIDAEIGRREWLTDQEREVLSTEQQAALLQLRAAFQNPHKVKGSLVDAFLQEKRARARKELAE